MSDIFISYSKKDRRRAEQLANALEAQGWSVWWDTRLKGGEIWDEVIEGVLDSARAVVVLWSRSSIKSRWVKREARYADKRQILVPAFIESVELPLEFSDVQAEDLTRWRGGASHPGFVSLRTALEGLPKKEPLQEKETGRAAARAKRPKKPVKRQKKRTIVSTDHRNILIDAYTLLMWTREDNGEDIDWNGAKEYARNLRLGGYCDWRLPIIEELELLYDPDRKDRHKIIEPFQLTSPYVWSSSTHFGDAWNFAFDDGMRCGPDPNNPAYVNRALCVRHSEE